MTKRATQGESTQDALRPLEAARISGLTTMQLARMAERGELTVSRPGGSHRRYRRSEIERLAQPVKAGAQR